MSGKMILGALAIGMTLFLASQAFAVNSSSQSGSLGSILKQDNLDQSQLSDRDMSSDMDSGLATPNDELNSDMDTSSPLSDRDQALRDQDQMSDTGSLDQSNSNMQGKVDNNMSTTNQSTSSTDSSNYLWSR